jgi:hypothetical protein
MSDIKIISNLEFGNYLRTKPLYSKFLVTEHFTPQPKTYSYPSDFDDLFIKFTCKNDGENQTFKCNYYQVSQQFRLAPPSFNDMINLTLPPFWDKTTRMLDLTLPIVAECQFCKEKVYFLLNIFSDGPFNSAESLFPNIYIQKVGQLPAFDIRPEKEILNYVTSEDRGNYAKALANLSISYGIGAFAYFRRIIENEIKRMAKDIIGLDTKHSAILEAAYATLEQDHQMNKFITAFDPLYPTITPRFRRQSN